MITPPVVDSFWRELEKIAKSQLDVPGMAPSFAGGIDPFGIYTSEIGQQAQRAGATPGQHRARDLAGTAGGVVGGAAILPAAIGGVAGAGRGFASTSGGLGRRLTGAAQGAFQGAVAPFKGLYHATRSSRVLRRAAKSGGTKLSPAEKKSLEHTIGETPLRAVADKAEHSGGAKGVAPDQAATIRLLKARKALEKGEISGELGKQLQQPVTTAVGSGATQLALGGAVGGLGAHVQYAKGRQSEKKFQQRLKEKK